MPTVNMIMMRERVMGWKADVQTGTGQVRSAVLFQPKLGRQARHLAAAGPGRCWRRTAFAPYAVLAYENGGFLVDLNYVMAAL